MSINQGVFPHLAWHHLLLDVRRLDLSSDREKWMTTDKQGVFVISYINDQNLKYIKWLNLMLWDIRSFESTKLLAFLTYLSLLKTTIIHKNIHQNDHFLQQKRKGEIINQTFNTMQVEFEASRKNAYGRLQNESSKWLHVQMQETLQDADEDMLHEWAVRKLNKQMPQTQATSF